VSRSFRKHSFSSIRGKIDISWMKEEVWDIQDPVFDYLEFKLDNDRALRRVLGDMTKLVTGSGANAGRYMKNDDIWGYITRVVKKNWNFHFNIGGLPGSGKSTAAQILATFTRSSYRSFAKDAPQHPKAGDYSRSTVHVVFPMQEANELLSSLRPGDILIKDEGSKISGVGSTIAKDANNNIKKAVRSMNINFIDCDPEQVITPTTRYYFFAIGYSIELEITLALVYSPHLEKKNAAFLIGYVVLPRRTNEEFLENYMRKKLAYNQTLMDNQGRESVKLDTTQLEKDAEQLIELAREKAWNPESQKDFGILFDMAGLESKSSNYYSKVCRLAYVLWQQMRVSSVSARDEADENYVSTEARRYEADGSKFTLLRDKLKSYFMHRQQLPEPVARILTSLYLWKDQMYRSGAKPTQKNRVLAQYADLDNMNINQVSKIWLDELSNPSQSFYTNKSSQGELLESKQHVLTRSSHDAESIGEEYAYESLRVDMAEHLSPHLSSSNVLRLQHTDTFTEGASMPHDVAVVGPGGVAVASLNHKLLTSGKKIGPGQYSKNFGSVGCPVKVLWLTWTRPFREELYLRVDGALAGRAAAVLDVPEGEGTEGTEGGLGAYMGQWGVISCSVLVRFLAALAGSAHEDVPQGTGKEGSG